MPHFDPALAELAARRHGLLTTDQLRAAGLDRQAVHRLVRAGLLHLVYPGVFALGFRPTDERRKWCAAVLAHGQGSALAGVAGLRHLEITRRRRIRTIDVVSPRKHRPMPGVTSRRSQFLQPYDIIEHAGIPLLRPALLIASAAIILPAREITAVIHEAQYRDLLELNDLDAVIHDRRCRRGRANLRLGLEYYRGGELGTLSGLEARGVAWLEDQPIEQPVVNTLVHGVVGTYRVDLFWPRWGLCAELDGPVHDLPDQRRADEARDADLALVGHRTIRVRGADFDRHPAVAMAPILECLVACTARGTSIAGG